MIRKISMQDVVSKRATKNTREDYDFDGADPRRKERDFLIERLTRKSHTPSIAESPAKAIKHKTHTKKTDFHFGNRWIWLLIPLVVVVFIFVAMQLMVSAVVTVKPKQVSVPVDIKLNASINATTSPNALGYQIITLNATDSEIVMATGTVPTKPTKATGQITIFNNFSATAQPLIKNTRFETGDGLIYRIENGISIPGFKNIDGKKVPGSITVTVTADQVGAKYNIDTVDFTIPGFKTNADRYTKIFARSKTAMTGGSDGNSFGVSAETRATTEVLIQARLKETLLRQAQSQKTANSVIFNSASKVSFQALPDTAGVDAQHVVMRVQGTISSVAFDKQALSRLILGTALKDVGGTAEVTGIEDLNFLAAVSVTSPIWQAKPFAFTLTGPVTVTGSFDTDKFIADIKGVPQDDLNKLLPTKYPTIEKATANFKPFWKSDFPTDASKIKIEIVK